MDNTYVVYTLSERMPNPTTFYIGRSTLGRLGKRLKEHKNKRHISLPKGKYISEIRCRGGKLDILPLEFCSSYSESFNSETYWIHQFKEWGFTILNKNKTKSIGIIKTGGKIRYNNVTQQYVPVLIKKSFTKSELKLINRSYKPGDYRRISEMCDKGAEMIRIILRGKQKLVRVELYDLIKKFYKFNQ